MQFRLLQMLAPLAELGLSVPSTPPNFNHTRLNKDQVFFLIIIIIGNRLIVERVMSVCDRDPQGPQ